MRSVEVDQQVLDGGIAADGAMPDVGVGRVDGRARARRLLIADHPATRMGIRLALGPDTEVCAEAGDADSAVEAAQRTRPDIALVGCEGLTDWRTAVRGICRAVPGCAVIVLAPTGNADEMLDSVRAGAVGFVPGPLGADRLRTVVGAALRREAVIPRTMVLTLLDQLRGGDLTETALTGREAQVLRMVRCGDSTASIAGRLQIAPVTVRRHISELVRKLGVASRSDLVE